MRDYVFREAPGAAGTKVADLPLPVIEDILQGRTAIIAEPGEGSADDFLERLRIELVVRSLGL